MTHAQLVKHEEQLHALTLYGVEIEEGRTTLAELPHWAQKAMKRIDLEIAKDKRENASILKRLSIKPNDRTQPQPPGKRNAEHRDADLPTTVGNGEAGGCWLE